MLAWMAFAPCCRAIGSTSSCMAIQTVPACLSGLTMAASGPISPSRRRDPKYARRCGHPSALSCSVRRHLLGFSARNRSMPISWRQQLAALVLMWLGSAAAYGAAPPGPADNLGPYNLTFLEGGVGLTRPLAADSPALAANGAWSISGWLRPALAQPGDVIIAAVGGTSAASCRCLALHDGKLQLRVAGSQVTAQLHGATWQAIA